ncbi:MAG: single-stranded DNA-binding protein [Candidatus Cryptobacteroides sp.]
MEQLNRIEIRGHVGNVNVVAVGEGRVAHFSVVTNFAYKSRNNEPVIETTWHNVTAWESKSIQDLGIIRKGQPIYVSGRFRIQKVSGNDGVEKSYNEVLASIVEPVKESLTTGC